MQAYYQYANHTAWGAYKERLRLAEPDPSYISYEIYFDSGERRTNRDDPLKLPTRSTAPSSRLVLAPVLWGFSAGAEFTWTVRTATVDAEGHATAGSETTAGSRGTAEYFNFQSAAPGTYLVSCTAREAGNTASAAVLVQVVNPAAARARGPQSSRSPNACYGAVDAPQQHLGMYPGFDISGENGHGETWMTAQHGKRLRNEPTEEPGVGPYWGGWSLGPLGYLIFGFDHSIMARESGDEIGIRGNACSGWEEPGIISVMQDTNGNGLPDDTWYELKGSQHGRYGHIPRYAMRYFYPFKKTGGSSFRPVGNFVWVDNRGNTGAERQPYPWFVAGESITFSGTIVAQGTGMTGYTDTHDTKFSIADAVQADGTPVSLDHIDFVRVHGAVTGGGFGGYSTEIAGMADASIPLDAATLPGEPAATEGQYNYTFINDSGYVLTVDLYILSEGNAVQMTRFTLDTGVTAIKQYQFNPLIVEFSGGNAELAITSSTARFTSTGGGGI
jgi:hypothetical protein